MCVHCVLVQYAALSHYRRFVCVCLELLSGWDLDIEFYDQMVVNMDRNM